MLRSDGIVAEPAIIPGGPCPLPGHSLTATAEFAFLCMWLGRCRSIGQLGADTGLGDGIGSTLDMEFETGLHALVHVKAKAENNLGVRAEIFEPLKRHAAALGVPLLIAWKRYSHWKLVDSARFRVADGAARIHHGEAARQNLLGLLAGDQAFHIERGAGIELAPIPPLQGGAPMRLESLSRTMTGLGAAGERLPRFPNLYRQLLALVPLDLRPFPDAAGVIRYEAREAVGYAHQFVVAAINQGRPDSRFAHARLLMPGVGDGSHTVMPSMAEVVKALAEARQDGLVAGVFRPCPFDIPDFLSALDA